MPSFKKSLIVEQFQGNFLNINNNNININNSRSLSLIWGNMEM